MWLKGLLVYRTDLIRLKGHAPSFSFRLFPLIVSYSLQNVFILTVWSKRTFYVEVSELQLWLWKMLALSLRAPTNPLSSIICVHFGISLPNLSMVLDCNSLKISKLKLLRWSLLWKAFAGSSPKVSERGRSEGNKMFLPQYSWLMKWRKYLEVPNANSLFNPELVDFLPTHINGRFYLPYSGSITWKFHTFTPRQVKIKWPGKAKRAVGMNTSLLHSAPIRLTKDSALHMALSMASYICLS